MPGQRVILDACILFDAALRDILLRAAEAGLFELRWGDTILVEVRRALQGTTKSAERP